jgi:hypothetical protein
LITFFLFWRDPSLGWYWWTVKRWISLTRSYGNVLWSKDRKFYIAFTTFFNLLFWFYRILSRLFSKFSVHQLLVSFL